MSVHRQWKTNTARVELELWTGCNLSCPNCDRSSAQAPSWTGMTVDQVAAFVNESIRLPHRWERVVLLGGEPTLHPQIDEVISELNRLHEAFPGIEFRLYTNGYGKHVQRVLRRLPIWIAVHNTGKTREPPLFSPYNMAPCDDPAMADASFENACPITEWCGLGITRHGIYPCGAGAAVARVFGNPPAISALTDLTAERLAEQLRSLCKLCGHFGRFEEKLGCRNVKDPAVLTSWTTQQKTSPSWARAYKDYKAGVVHLPVMSIRRGSDAP